MFNSLHHIGWHHITLDGITGWSQEMGDEEAEQRDAAAATDSNRAANRSMQELLDGSLPPQGSGLSGQLIS